MIVRIIQRSGLEAAIARFDGWWNARSPRERLLFIVMSVLIGGAVLLYGVAMPLQNARAKAYADIRTYETLNARIRAAGKLQPQQPQQRGGPPIVIVTTSASAFGFTPEAIAIPGGVRATIADAPYDGVMSWLAELGATSRLQVKRVEMKRQPAAGQVSAIVDFAQ